MAVKLITHSLLNTTKEADVAVAFFNADYQVWEPQPTGWVFLNDTTLRFDIAPEIDQKLIIYRCTDLDATAC